MPAVYVDLVICQGVVQCLLLYFAERHLHDLEILELFHLVSDGRELIRWLADRDHAALAGEISLTHGDVVRLVEETASDSEVL